MARIDDKILHILTSSHSLQTKEFERGKRIWTSNYSVVLKHAGRTDGSNFLIFLGYWTKQVFDVHNSDFQNFPKYFNGYHSFLFGNANNKLSTLLSRLLLEILLFFW